MALLHRAELHPTKLELLAGWLPGRWWYQGSASPDVVRVAAYRFDDPAGAVGIETLLVTAGDGPVYQVPLTYRGAPLHGGDDWLIGTTEHSVLGRRWVYDACGDPVYVEALVSAVFGRTGQAEEFLEVDGRLERRSPSMTVSSGSAAPVGVPDVGSLQDVVDDDPAVIMTDSVELAVVRRLGDGAGRAEAMVNGKVNGTVDGMLNGTWSGQAAPLPLAYATLR